MTDTTDNTTTETQLNKTKKPGYTKRTKIIISVILSLLVLVLSYASYVYAATPAVVRDPKLEHYHFRMQILVNGKAEDFSSKLYQTGYAKDQCNASLPEQPIHFHDNKDQFTHIHWEGMTGGMVMKYYGWNYIGGMNNALGYKLSDLKDIQKVTIHGNFLPAVPPEANMYVYTGDENGYAQRSFDDWTNQDLEQFFGKKSNSPAHDINKNGGEEQASVLDKLFPKASAHGAEDTAGSNSPTTGSETQAEKLTRINNLLGNVVIFAQKDKPTDDQIKARFNNLEPLTDSTCGG